MSRRPVLAHELARDLLRLGARDAENARVLTTTLHSAHRALPEHYRPQIHAQGRRPRRTIGAGGLHAALAGTWRGVARERGPSLESSTAQGH